MCLLFYLLYLFNRRGSKNGHPIAYGSAASKSRGRRLLARPRLLSWRKDATNFTYEEMLIAPIIGNMTLILNASFIYCYQK
jgi:hypothetical protein